MDKICVIRSNINWDDLTKKAQMRIMFDLGIDPIEEGWDKIPMFVIEREVEP